MSATRTLLLILGLVPATAAQLLSWNGAAADDNFGSGVAFAGDVNADGYDDVIVGAPFADPLGLSQAGRATIYSGANGAVLHVLNGAQAGERQGWAVAGLGDVNDDGHADVAVAAPAFNSSASTTQIGAVRVYSGATGAQLFQMVGPKAGSWFGSDVAGAGDWNGDGTPDLVAGAPVYAKLVGLNLLESAGYASVVSGAGPTTLNSYTGSAEHDTLGHAVAGGRDVDGGGKPDIVVGAWESDAGAPAGGRVRVYSGETKAAVFTKDGWLTTQTLGSDVALGDFDGDGFADVLAGAYFQNSQAGAAYIYRGPAGAGGQVTNGLGTGDFYGYAVACVGDADHDGRDDYAVGAYQSGAADNGYVRVLSGPNGALIKSLNGLADLDHFGVALGGGGDSNGDGWPDLIVGADLHDVGAADDAGRASVHDLTTHQQNLGFGGPGSAFLDVYGAPLKPGFKADLHLTNAKANAPALLFASALQNPTPFKGGVLVPDLGTALQLTLATNGQGKILLAGIKGGGGPYDVYVQITIKDPAQPKGWAVSNAVKMQFLP